MLEYLPLIILVVFAAIQGWKNRISVEEYKRRKAEKRASKKKYPSPKEQWDLFVKTKDTSRVLNNYRRK